MDKLTLKQKRFADEYLVSGNSTEAAVKAGYSARTARAIGSENLTKPAITDYLESRLKELESNRIAKAEETLEFLTAAMRGEHSEEVTFISGGEVVTTRKAMSLRDRIKSAELLGKRYRLFTDRVEADLNMTAVIFEGEDDIED